MTTGQLFHRYVWIVNALQQSGRMKLRDLNERWVDDKVDEGNPLPRSSFNKFRATILDMFGLIIECDKQRRYYISNPDNLHSDRLSQWMLSTLTTGLTLSSSTTIRDSIILENVPAGYEFLPVILQAIRETRTIEMGYQKFGFEGICWPTTASACRSTPWTACCRPR